MDLNNIVGFKAVDKNGNERQVTVDEMTELVSARIVSAASEISTFAAAAAAGTDEFEDQLPQSDTFSWLRTLDGSKNPTLTSSSAAAKVLGGLLEINKIINGFTSESFSLHKGESKRIKANGILVICSQYYNLYPSIAVISPATKNIEYIGGYKEYVDGTLFTFTFKNDYTTIMTSKIEGVEGSRVPFLIAYQNLLP
ncbi:hypothetical protein [Phocaeicola vulgatus]|uniref:hypothetical protein n=1 Tax=Phocaeicola vulgatus TaxID=821 RepID=UPI0039B489BD